MLDQIAVLSATTLISVAYVERLTKTWVAEKYGNLYVSRYCRDEMLGGKCQGLYFGNRDMSMI